MALPAPFVSGKDASLARTGSLQTELTNRLGQAGPFKDVFKTMGIALVDLTAVAAGSGAAGAVTANFASNALLDTQFAVGSLTKVAPMFAAFRLRDRVALAAAAVGSTATKIDEVVANVTADWTPLVSRKISKPPNDFPDLERIFDFTAAAPWTPKFKNGNQSWDALDGLHESSKATIDPLDFMDRMKLAVRFSDNLGAGSIARDVGFQYMNGVLREEGFADNTRNGFLWLGGDFGHTTSPPIMGAPPWDTSQGATWVRANARGIASFFTLVWTSGLVDGPSSKEMRDILLEQPVGYATNLTNSAPGTSKKKWSKTGILSTVSEGAIVEAGTDSGRIRYAGVGLASPGDAPLKELARIFSECIQAVHPFT